MTVVECGSSVRGNPSEVGDNANEMLPPRTRRIGEDRLTGSESVVGLQGQD